MIDLIAITSLAVGILGVVITVFIYFRQEKQMDDLRDIEKETSEITQKLNTDKDIQKRKKEFFGVSDTEKNFSYNFFYPADYNKKTLPLINAADSYAMFAISNLLGVDHVNLVSVKRYSDEVELGDSDAIITCSANPALKKIFPFDEETIELPCWFSETKDKDGKGDFRIWIKGTSPSLRSDADEVCKKAGELADGEKLGEKDPIAKDQMNRIHDYGIFARLHKNGHQYVIIAGIHGFGTWITAKLFNDLIMGKEFNHGVYNNVFFGNDDFMAIVEGEFNGNEQKIRHKCIYMDYVWTKDKEDGWIRARAVEPRQ